MSLTTLKILNYNLWHGLNGDGTLSFGELEKKDRRKKRRKLQIELLKEQDADVIFLQEVSPLYPRAREIARALRKSYVAHYDQAGIKILGMGIPNNLETGLVILARKELKLKNAKGIKLSGGAGFLSRVLSIQASEFRYALSAEINWRGRPIQLINTHLHHGPVISQFLQKKLDTFFENNKNINRQAVTEVLEHSRLRRMLEVQRLVRELQPGHKILCGDLNVEETDPLINLLKDSGLRDLFFKSGLLTWDRDRNLENHSITRDLKLIVPTQGSQQLKDIFREYDARPRRIDYIMTTPEFSVLEKSMVMDQSRDNLIGSDHFGLFVRLGF
jgi:endonuclease/exonuclease/phosphatase family metal-dependent hydrolase